MHRSETVKVMRILVLTKPRMDSGSAQAGRKRLLEERSKD